MSAANRRDAIDRGKPVRVTMLRGESQGETIELPYRKAVGLISLGRAEWAAKPKPAKKSAK